MVPYSYYKKWATWGQATGVKTGGLEGGSDPFTFFKEGGGLEAPFTFALVIALPTL